jgi:(4S)-4-hydroxy-5-phosphonooxypentane-2,3-dione isomerase
MYVVCVSICVKDGRAEAFAAASLANARATRGEPGNLRFDVLRRLDDPNRFSFYEAYRTAEDFAAHQKTGHYLQWREAVADWMAEPRVGLKHESLFPGEDGW